MIGRHGPATDRTGDGHRAVAAWQGRVTPPGGRVIGLGVGPGRVTVPPAGAHRSGRTVTVAVARESPGTSVGSGRTAARHGTALAAPTVTWHPVTVTVGRTRPPARGGGPAARAGPGGGGRARSPGGPDTL